MDRYCRLCWNTLGWRRPSGDARHAEVGSYVTRHGFGHEEWLFNNEWQVNGYRYAFLQPINKSHAGFEGQTFSVFLYTRRPFGGAEAVGVIRNLHVPLRAELAAVKKEYVRRGWLEQMGEDLKLIGVSPGLIEHAPVDSIVNVRFSPEEVDVFDPRPAIAKTHALSSRSHRYIAYKWTDEWAAIAGTQPHAGGKRTSSQLKSEKRQARKGTLNTEVDPHHTRLQNRLFKTLQKQGRDVEYENNWVDLSLHEDTGTTYFEIKMATSVRRCVRDALGQLLDYAHFPSDSRAERLVVVGDVFPKQNDKEYLGYLRTTYKLPVYYARFNWDKNELEQPV